ncbi:hypothetical protein B0H14DRAFT_3577939 [Mycena olivaceomarginata]|nr:hypothetical protein B0H14DRAFT_3577939 [Mycena olivaceomarginata]
MWRLAVHIEDEDLGHRLTSDSQRADAVSSRPLRPFVHWRHLLRQSDEYSSHLCGCTRHSNPTPPRLPPASSTILWTSDDDTRYYHVLDGGFASKRYAYSHLLALYGYWDDLWNCSGSMFAETACAPGGGPHGERQREHTLVSADADLWAALWAGGGVDTELIRVCPGVPDASRSRCARRRHHLVRAGATCTVLRESCTGAVSGARAHFPRIAGTGGGVAAAASVRAAAERAPLRERDQGRDRIDDEIYEETFPELAEARQARRGGDEEPGGQGAVEGVYSVVRVFVSSSFVSSLLGCTISCTLPGYPFLPVRAPVPRPRPSLSKKVKDYNLGSLIRTDARQEYGENNTIFGTLRA